MRKALFMSLAVLVMTGCVNKENCNMKKEEIKPPVIKTTAEPVTLISIIPAFHDNVDYLAEMIKERYLRSGISDYALSCSLHPQGDDPMQKPLKMAATFRKLKKKLKDSPHIRLGMLFQSLIGHGAVYNPNSKCAMKGTRLRNLDGKEIVLYCPNDQNFQKYIDQAVYTMAKEGPAFCLTDDDVRVTADFCSCKLHLADISKRCGIKVDRKRLASAVRNIRALDDMATVFDGKKAETEDERICAAFLASKIASVDSLCKVVRNALDRVDSKISCGSCMIYMPEYINSRMKILTGEAGSPMLRVSSGLYLELAVKDLALRMGSTGVQHTMFGNRGWTLLDEADTCPHNRYSKTARTMHLHLTVAIAQGLDGGKMWFDQGAYPLRHISLPYETIVGKHQGFYRELRRMVTDWKQYGYVTRVAPPERGTPRMEDWNSQCFNHMGIPGFHGDVNVEGITALSGSMHKHFTDDEIRKMLSGKVLLDGDAAEALTRRGFASLIGVEAVRKEISVSSETCHLTGVRSPFRGGANAVFFKKLPGSEVLGTVNFIQSSGAKPKKVMPGTVYFRNKLGGEVLSSAMLICKWHFMHVLTPSRKLVYLAWTKKLGGVPCYVPEEISVKLFAGRTDDGALAITLFNFSYDPFKVKLATAEKVSKVLELQAEGDWKAVDFEYKDGTLEIDRTLDCAGIGVYKLF